VPADDSPPQGDVTGQQPSDPTSTRPLTDDTSSPVKCPLCAAAVPDREVLLRHLTAIHHVDERMSVTLVGGGLTGTDSVFPSSCFLA